MTTEAVPPRMEPLTAGALLREAREAAGLSLDAVAQQLKLAPRQVEALESGDYSRLPGRTFVRGFMRNYARLLHLDDEALLSALPGDGAAPSLASPTLHATASSIGELPSTQRARSAWTLWAIPLALIAIVVAAVVYEYAPRGASDAREQPARASAPAKSTGETTTALPNPATVLSAEPAAPSDSVAPIVAPSTPAAPVRATAGEAPVAAVAPPPAAPAAAPVAAPVAVEEATMVLDYRDFSWTEVRDRTGRVLVARMMRGGERQSVTGEPPFDVVIGNAADVKATFRGKPVDLASVSRGNVARFTLR
jgi:cytoskeleton protein RodZ